MVEFFSIRLFIFPETYHMKTFLVNSSCNYWVEEFWSSSCSQKCMEINTSTMIRPCFTPWSESIDAYTLLCYSLFLEMSGSFILSLPGHCPDASEFPGKSPNIIASIKSERQMTPWHFLLSLCIHKELEWAIYKSYSCQKRMAKLNLSIEEANEAVKRIVESLEVRKTKTRESNWRCK